MAEREREKTNHQKEAAFALSGEIEIPGEKHLENIIAGISRESEKLCGILEAAHQLTCTPEKQEL